MKADTTDSPTAPLPRAQNVYKDAALKEMRDQLAVDHVGYVRHVLNRTVANLPERIDKENLESAGVLGLVEASRRFDPTQDVDFKTFATPRIRGAILDELRRNSPVPQKMLQMMAKVRQASETLPPPVTAEDIAAFTGMDLEDVEQALATMRFTQFSSWQDSVSLHEIANTRSENRPSANLEAAERRQILIEAIQQLSERERTVLTLYHFEDLRLREIGEVVDMTESGVCRCLAKAEFNLAQIIKSRYTQMDQYE